MSNHTLLELQLINAAIDSRDPHYLTRLGVSRDWFPTYRTAYDFIADHIRQHNEVPTLSTVAGACADVEYVEYESGDILKRRLGDALAKRELAEWLRGTDSEGKPLKDKADVSKSFDSLKCDIERKTQELDHKYGTRTDNATNWRTNGEQRFANYVERETNKRALIPSGFAAINRALTGKDDAAFMQGDYVVVYGRTKRGKSHLVRKLTTLPAIRAGFRVLDLCLENERSEIEFMLDSIEAADNDALPVIVDGVTMAGGFNRKRLVFGYLDADEREAYRQWTEDFNESNSQYSDYVIKTFEDSDMDTVDIAKIESLIDEYKPDVLLVDPIYLTTYPRVNEKTPGGGAQAMSRALRRLATRKRVVIVVTVQATMDEGAKDDEDGELNPPELSKVKTSKALLEDGTVTFGIDSVPGKAVIEVMLSRKGGAGARADVHYVPNYGIVRAWDEAVERQLAAANAVKLF